MQDASSLIAKLEQRFLEADSNVVYAFLVLGLKPLSVLFKQERDNQGNDKIETIIRHYSEEKKYVPTKEQLKWQSVQLPILQTQGLSGQSWS